MSSLEIDSTPAARPAPVVLTGRFGRVERLHAARHGPDLWKALAGYDQTWTYMSYGPFADADEFSRWLEQRVALSDPFSYAVVGPDDNAVGIVTLMEIRPAMRVVEIGNIVYSPALQRTALATEAQWLLACYAFETLDNRRYEWKCDALNSASRHAALRLGFSFEGLFRQHMIVKGRNRDTAWYAMLDSEWPGRKPAFERWLARENFDAAGVQRMRLSEFQSAFRFD